MASEFQGQFQEAMREAEMADLKKSVDEVNAAARGFAYYDPMNPDGLEPKVEAKSADAATLPAREEPLASPSVESSAPALPGPDLRPPEAPKPDEGRSS